MTLTLLPLPAPERAMRHRPTDVFRFEQTECLGLTLHRYSSAWGDITGRLDGVAIRDRTSLIPHHYRVSVGAATIYIAPTRAILRELQSVVAGMEGDA